VKASPKKKPVGKPPKFTAVEDMEIKIEAYFKYCELNILPPTLNGLAISLDIDRKTLLNYSRKEEYFPAIKRAKERVEMWVEKELLFRTTGHTGLIFWLKNNAGWKDEQHQRVSFDFSKLTDEELEAIAAGQSEA
jgi:hypothetical protein